MPGRFIPKIILDTEKKMYEAYKVNDEGMTLFEYFDKHGSPEYLAACEKLEREIEEDEKNGICR